MELGILHDKSSTWDAISLKMPWFAILLNGVSGRENKGHSRDRASVKQIQSEKDTPPFPCLTPALKYSAVTVPGHFSDSVGTFYPDRTSGKPRTREKNKGTTGRNLKPVASITHRLCRMQIKVKSHPRSLSTSVPITLLGHRPFNRKL